MDSLSLLLVDDDDVFCTVLARALAERGYTVSAAANAEEAILLARECLPRFAVVDLKMPGSSGLSLIKDLLALDAEMRIVMLTGYASIATAVEAIKLGAAYYLAKPVDADQIVAALARGGEGDASLAVPDDPPSLKRVEWEHIQTALAEHQGNISETARALKMHRRTLQRKLMKRPVKQ